jgi:hypothetical protein
MARGDSQCADPRRLVAVGARGATMRCKSLLLIAVPVLLLLLQLAMVVPGAYADSQRESYRKLNRKRCVRASHYASFCQRIFFSRSYARLCCEQFS